MVGPHAAHLPQVENHCPEEWNQTLPARRGSEILCTPVDCDKVRRKAPLFWAHYHNQEDIRAANEELNPGAYLFPADRGF